MENNKTDRLLPQANTVQMRLYGQGLGDCFLLAFPRPDNNPPCYVLIDCGCAKGTPDEKGRMRGVISDIIAATGGTIDVLVITHLHYDHVIGFRHGYDLWTSPGLTVKSLWLPWTEIPGDADAAKVRQKQNALNEATIQAMRRAQDPAAQKFGFGISDDAGALRAEAGFLGVDLGADAGSGTAGGFSLIQDAFEKALGLLKNGNPVYCEPGDVLRLPGSDFHAFVLGPPRESSRISLLVDEGEMYHYSDIGMSPDSTRGSSGSHAFLMQADVQGEGLAAALGGVTSNNSGDRYCPFDARVRIDWDQAMLLPFFDQHYRANQEWRCVDDDWLDGAANLGLQAGNYTNNISLVLAFEMPNSKRILLFPGDAQVGNWLSWHDLSRWRPVGGASAPTGAPDMKDLLGRVAFYKVGHHGSHNATIKEKGLELMPDDMLAYIPVSVPIAHDIMGYCPMPFYPVVRRLQTKTGGRVFLSNGKLVQPLPPGANVDALHTGVIPAVKMLPAMKKDGILLEEEVPLYLEVTLNDQVSHTQNT